MIRFVCLLLLSVVGTTAGAQLPFNVAKVEAESIPEYFVLDARIEAVQQSTVSAQLAGEITQIHFDVDDFVEKDSVLIEFKNKGEEAEWRAAAATQQEAQAHLQDAEQEFARIKDIYEKKLVSKANFDKAQGELKAAQAREKAAKAKRDAAQERFDKTIVRAPYAGIVAKRLVEPGETTSVGKPLMTGYSLEQLRAVALIPQRFITKVRTLQQAEVMLDDQVLESTKVVFVPHSQNASHTFEVRVLLPDNTPGVYPGQFVKVRFDAGRREALMVPKSAVVHRSEVTGIYVIGDKDVLQFRQIRIGQTLPGDKVEILAGMSAGEKIAAEPIKAGVALKEQRKAP